MELISFALLALGGVISIVGSVWFLIVAFQESVLWGLVVLFFPLASLVFLFVHADRAFAPFLVQIWGVAMVFLGAFVLGV